MQAKAGAKEEALRRLLGGSVEMSSQPTLEDPPSEPPPESLNLGPNELYELLVDLKLRGFDFTAGEDVLAVRPASALAQEEIALLKKHKAAAIAWIVGLEEHRRLRLRIKAALEEWFVADEGARVWALTLPRRGEKYVAAQFWQVERGLADRGVIVKDEKREVAAVVLMEVVREIVGEEAA